MDDISNRIINKSNNIFKLKQMQRGYERKIRSDREEWGKIIKNQGLAEKQRVRTKGKKSDKMYIKGRIFDILEPAENTNEQNKIK